MRFGALFDIRSAGVVSALAAMLTVSSAEAAEVRYSGEGHAQNPVWSLDGDHLAFEVNRYDGGTIQLFIAPIQGTIARDSTRVSLPSGGGAFGGGSGQVTINPTWHASGLAIFEGANQRGVYRFYFQQPGGGGSAQQLLQTSQIQGNLSFPSFSPTDENVLGFVAAATGKGDIRTWNRSTGEFTEVTNSPVPDMYPAFSSDGQKIVFSREVDNADSIFEADLASGNARELQGGGADQSRPVYTADGGIVYFVSPQGEERWDVAYRGPGGSVNVLGTNVRLPERAPPALSPDGNHVVFTHVDTARDNQVTFARLDGSGSFNVETEYRACGEPAVTEQGDRIILAYTALRASGADWRRLFLEDITDRF